MENQSNPQTKTAKDTPGVFHLVLPVRSKLAHNFDADIGSIKPLATLCCCWWLRTETEMPA